MGEVITELGLYPGCRALADALARRSDDTGKPVGHPVGGIKVATLAADCRLSERHVHRCLRLLECHGLLGIEHRAGAGQSSRPSLYHLAFRAWSRGAQLLGRWRENVAAKRAAHEPEPAPYPSGTFICGVCGWEGLRGPCRAAHGPPDGVSPTAT